MNILEFQVKNFCKKYGIPVPQSYLIPNINSIYEFNNILDFPLILKAQVRSKQRARNGGIFLARTLEEATQILPRMFTGKVNNQPVKLILAEKMIEIKSGYAIKLKCDRKNYSINLSASQSFTSLEKNGGQIHQIENKIQCQINPLIGIMDSTITEIAVALEIEHKNWCSFRKILQNIWDMYDELDVVNLEIDPLVIGADQEFFVLGIDIEYDDNALFRHPEFIEIYENGPDEDLQNLLRKLDCDYLKSKGDICVLSRSMEMCAAIADILEAQGKEVSESIAIKGNISVDKIAVILNKIMELSKSKIIIIHSAGTQTDNQVLLEGVRLYQSNSSNNLKIILKNDVENIKTHVLEKDLKNLILIDSLNDISRSLELIIKGKF